MGDHQNLFVREVANEPSRKVDRGELAFTHPWCHADRRSIFMPVRHVL